MNERIDDSTARYIRHVNELPKLDLEQELDLARAYQQDGDKTAADAIIRANLRHVVPHALRYRGKGLPTAELIAEGNLALITSLDRFDPDRGLRFITYANHWIRSEMLALVLRTRTMVGGGRGHQRGRYVFGLQRQHAHLSAKLGDEAAVRRELSERFGRSEKRIGEILERLRGGDRSLDAPMGEAGPSMGEMLCADGDLHDDQIEREQMQAELSVAVSAATGDLSDRERVILTERLMADQETRKSLVELGRSFGISRERVRQIEARLKQKLRGRLKPVARRWEVADALAA